MRNFVKDEQFKALPEKLFLNQNYPNPFNASTIIEFELNKKEQITLNIYNSIGQKIYTLIDSQYYSAGTHKIYWDGKISDDTYVPSRIYFYQLETSRKKMSRKMLMLK